MVLLAADGLRNDQIAAQLRCLRPRCLRAEVIRLACERPADCDVTLARWSAVELAREAVAPGICEQISGITSNDFPDLANLEQQLHAFGRRYERTAQPFEWKFTRADLDRLAHKLDLPHRPSRLARLRRRTSEPER